MPKDRILVGQFGAPHGVKGEVRLKSFTQDPAAIAGYGRLTDASGTRHIEILALRPLKDDLFVARIKGVVSREAAQALTNTPLYLARDALPPAADDEFYHADLIGLAALSEAGAEIGAIINVVNFGSGDILEIAPKEGGETLLIPFTKDAVPVVDIAGGQVVVVPPAEVDAAASFAAHLSGTPEDEGDNQTAVPSSHAASR